MKPVVRLQGIATRNLKGLTIEIPLGSLVGITGPSGSGKSSLAIHTLFAEGFLRYVEALAPDLRGRLDLVERPALESATNLPPAVCWRATDSLRCGPRDTVATLAGVLDPLAVLFARQAILHCPGCGRPLRRYTLDEIAGEIEGWTKGRVRIGFRDPGGAAALLRGGFSSHWDGRERRPITPELEGHPLWVWVDEVADPATDPSRLREALELCRTFSGREVLAACGHEERSFSFHLECPSCQRAFGEATVADFTSPSGAVDHPDIRHYRLDDRSIAAWLALPVHAVAEASAGLAVRLGPTPLAACAEELAGRLRRLDEAGLGHLPLDRSGPGLSHGERQRLSLLAVLNPEVCDALLVLEYPTSGLAPGEIAHWIGVLREACRRGNTVVAIDHDEALLAAADLRLVLGPAAGEGGGRLVDSPPSELPARDVSLPPPPTDWWEFPPARAHNLTGFSYRVPKGALTLIVGPVGAGKTSLLRAEIARHHRRGSGRWLSPALEIAADSAPQTIADLFGLAAPLRRWLAGQPQSRLLGLTPAHFSPHGAPGGCPRCHGRGQERIAMGVLPPLRQPCPDCGGSGFSPAVRPVTVGGLGIIELMSQSLEEFTAWAAAAHLPGLPVHPEIDRQGLGYLPLSRRLGDLSAAELQRVRLCLLLEEAATATGLLLDRPAWGLAPGEAETLAVSLAELTRAGVTIVAVDTHPALMRRAAHLIRLGPGGGSEGGRLLSAGPPPAPSSHIISRRG